MTVTYIQNYKILEEETTSSSHALSRTRTLLFDLSQDFALTSHLSHKMDSLLYDAEKITFISAYYNAITPGTFSGLAVVKWLPIDPTVEDVTDYCYPLFVASRDQGNTQLTEIIENYIYHKAQSQQYAAELTRGLFDD